MNGRIAFVFHISQDWNVWDGGLFMGMDWDWKTITKVVVPPFNTLTMFDVSNGMLDNSDLILNLIIIKNIIMKI